MKLVNINVHNLKYENYILIENINDLNEYYDTYRKRQIYNACDNLRENKYGFNLASVGISLHLIKNKTRDYRHKDYGCAIRQLAEIFGQVYTDQIEFLLKGYRLAINLIGGYMPLSNDDNIKFENISIPKKEILKVFKPQTI